MKLAKISLLCATFSVLQVLAYDFDHMLFRVFTDQEREIACFIDSVLRQVPSMHIIAAVQQAHVKSHNNLYEIITSLQRREPFFTKVKRQFQLLQFQKELVSRQIQQLLPGINRIGNYLEIGSPGTYGSKIRHNITGSFCVVTEKQQYFYDSVASYTSVTRYGYDKHIPLDGYEPLDTKIEANSIDLIVCAIGLHHIAQEKLVPFIASMNRILRPGGILILREHDAHAPLVVDLCYAAHSIFNAIIPQESVEKDRQEIRNFQPLSYWLDLFKENGFSVSEERLLQKGDTTKNTLIKIVKNCVTEEDHMINAHFYAKQQEHYLRDESQSFLTAPEWYNVDSAQEYAAFINHTPFFQFPYIKSVKNYWSIFIATFKEAAKKQKFLNTFFSSYTFMNLFVGVFMTLEYATKSIISFPVRKLYEGQEEGTILLLVKDNNNEITTILPEVIIKERYAQNILLIELPRYKVLTDCMLRLQKSTITVFTIAGNKDVMCKISYKEGTPMVLDTCFTKVVSWCSATDHTFIFAEYRVPVAKLSQFINTVRVQGGNFLYVHDF